MLKIKLTRSLAVLDIEATGTNPTTDRIIELAITRIHPDGTRDSKTLLVNPGIPIPVAAAAIHGFNDEDVRNFPTFAAIADEVEALLKNCDLGGFNLLRYDIPMLIEEFTRVGRTFDMEGRRVLDAQRIYHKMEPRTLSAALAFYCKAQHTNAHGAAADVDATIRVLEAQLQHYPDLPDTMEALDQFCNPAEADSVDRSGRLKWVHGVVTINFGKMKGVALKTLIEQDSSFIKWMLRSDFPSDVKRIVEEARDGKWPPKPLVSAPLDLT